MFVAGFIGSPKMNFIEGTVTSLRTASAVAVDLDGLGTLSLPRRGDAGLVGKPVTLGIRPEHLALGERRRSR